MGHSKAAKAASRDRILSQAAREVRRDGPAALSIAPLMASAGLTHGAFYSHFASRADLAAAAVDKALEDGGAGFWDGDDDFATIVRRYLSRTHRDHVEDGCGVAAMIGDILKDPGLRELVRARTRSYKAEIDRTNAGREDGWAVLATMLGALLLARLTDGAESDAILQAARRAILRPDMTEVQSGKAKIG